MKDVKIFCRVEKKYVINNAKKAELLSIMADKLMPDPYGKCTIASLYLDTPDFRLIRRSLEREPYKEKLRIRCYGIPTEEDKVFLEIKKKYKGTVYKRRESMTLAESEAYVKTRRSPKDTQIMHEINYAMDLYENPMPKMLVAYERDAYYAKTDPNLRITFDTNVRYRNSDLDLSHGNHGKTVCESDTVIMEVKTDGAMPLWLAHLLGETETYPSRFSKYGRSYLDMMAENAEGEKEYAKHLQPNIRR